MKHAYLFSVAAAALYLSFLISPATADAQNASAYTGGADSICVASPKPGDVGAGPHNGPSVGDYSLFATVRQATDAQDCSDECVFRVKYEIGFWDGNKWGEADPRKGGVYKDAYKAWHPDTGRYKKANIHWDYGDSSGTGNSSKSARTYKLACGASQVVYAEVSTNSPIPPSPATNPNAPPQIVRISVTVDLSCGKCEEDTSKVKQDTCKLQPHKTHLWHGDGLHQALAMSLISTAQGHHWMQLTGVDQSRQQEAYQLSIYNMNGQQMRRQRGVLGSEGYQRIAMDTQQLPAGMYIVRLDLGSGQSLSGRITVLGQ